jgi:type I restriction enzyme R subunit
MNLSESDTRAKLIDPAIHARGWTEDLMRHEEAAGAIEIIGGKPRKRARRRVDYVLRIKVNPQTVMANKYIFYNVSINASNLVFNRSPREN